MASQKENHDDLLNAAIEVKSRGARLIGLTDFSNSIFNDWLRVDFYPRYQAISMVIVGQLLAYNLSVLKGFNPDKPRNLAKSVTVN